MQVFNHGHTTETNEDGQKCIWSMEVPDSSEIYTIVLDVLAAQVTGVKKTSFRRTLTILRDRTSTSIETHRVHEPYEHEWTVDVDCVGNRIDLCVRGSVDSGLVKWKASPNISSV